MPTPHGSVAEEAAKLVDVAHLWLVSQSSRQDDGRPDADAAAEPAECRGCPICQFRRALAEVSPEVYQHLAEAVAALGAAVQALDGRRPRDPSS